MNRFIENGLDAGSVAAGYPTHRDLGETVVIGDASVQVTVLGVKGNQVRVGVSAPKSTPVHRLEIFESIQRGEPAPGGAK
jgi:carbon storage regulator